MILVYLIFGLLFSSIFFMFYFNKLTVRTLLLLVFIYILFFALFCILTLDFLGVFLFLIYVGGILVLILFSMFLLDLDKNIKHDFTFFINWFLFFIVFFISFFVFKFLLELYIPLNEQMVLTGNLFNIIETESAVYIQPTLLFSVIAYYMYTFYFLPFFGLVLLLYTGVIGIVLITGNTFVLNNNFLLFDLDVKFFFSRFCAIDSIVFVYLLSGYATFKSFVVVDLMFLFVLYTVFISLILSFFVCMSILNLIYYIVIVELFVLSTFFLLSVFSLILFDLSGIVFVFILLGVLAVETVVGLSLYWSSIYRRGGRVKF